MPLLFAVTLFLSASLLFLVQPMIGKMVLPLLGGSPAVWNTCMVFFQGALLAGYLYAHCVTRRLSRRAQLLLHITVLGLPLVPLLLLGFDAAHVARTWMPPPTESNPIGWLLALLLLTAGLPFFVVSTSAPLLQRWFADTGHPAGKDPYFLYAASNLGSMLALLGYPLLVEPNLSLATQTQLWLGCYAVLLLLTVICGLLILRPRSASPVVEAANGPNADTALEAPSVFRKIRWVALAFVPSSLMLGVTTYVTTDVAAIPLLWIIPLALYLLSFILVFTRLARVVGIAMAAIGVAAAGVFAAEHFFAPTVFADFLQAGPLSVVQAKWSLGAVAVLSLLLFLSAFPWLQRLTMLVALPLVIALVVAPPPWDMRPLTRPFDSVLGWDLTPLTGFFDPVLVIPVLLDWQKIVVHFLALFVAAMVCHGELARTRPPAVNLTEFYLLMSVGGVLGGLFNALIAPVAFQKVVEYPLVIALACLLLPRCGASRNRPVWRRLDLAFSGLMGLFGLVVGAALLAAAFVPYAVATKLPEPFRPWAMWILDPTGYGDAQVLFRDRSFFGIVRVQTWQQGKYHILVHGTTNHGMQCMEPQRQGEPLAYFHRQGPIGLVFEAVRERKSKVNMAVLGIGTGTLAAYAEPGWQLTLYEIDPAIVQMAFDRRYFTYLSDCKARGVPIDIHLGDGRMQLAKSPQGTFDLLFMDAFTSDAVPVHLITREAIDMYFTKLAPGGLLVVNIANRYLDLEPVLANLAAEAGLHALVSDDESDPMIDKYDTRWVVFVRDKRDFGKLAIHPRDEEGMWFQELRRDERVGVWTDDFSNLIRVMKWED